jgi:NHLM bacteriocin system ABC transporter ATP-binding protein
MSQARVVDLPLTGMTLAPGRPLPLAEENRFLRLDSGRVEIYAITSGRRHYLGEFTAGAVLFGGGVSPENRRETPLVAVAPEGASLTMLDTPTVLASAADAFRAGEVIAWVDRWLLVLSSGLARFAAGRPELRGAQGGEALEVTAGQSVSATQGVIWAERTDGGNLGLMGPDSPPRGVATLHPLTPATWATAIEPGRIDCRLTFAALRTEGWYWLLARFHSRVAGLIDTWSLAADNAENDRIAEREALTIEDLVQTNRRLKGVLVPPVKADKIPSEDAAFVCGIVAPALGPPPPGHAAPDDVRAYAEAAGARTREVWLSGTWWQADRGKLAATRNDGRPVALTTDWRGRYRIHVRGEPSRRVNAAVAQTLEPAALSIVPPLPNRPVKAWEVVVIGFRLCTMDLGTMVLASFASSLLGLVLPIAMSTIVDTFIPDQLRTGVLALGMALLALTLCATLLKIVGDLARLRMDGRLSAAIQAAVMDRTLRFPSWLLRSQASADLAMRVMSVDQMRRMVTNLALNTIMNGLFGLSGFFVLFAYSVPAAGVAVGLFVLLAVLAGLAGRAQLKALAQGEAMSANVTSFTLQLIQNVPTLRAFAAERRAFSVWARNAAEMRSRSMRSRRYYLAFDAFVASYDTIALAAIFAVLGYAASGNHLSTGAYLAFIATYQTFLISSEMLSRSVVQIMGAIPTLGRAQMLLNNAPETAPSAKAPGRLSGAIEVSNAVFSYGANLGPVLNGVSVRIEAGSFTALCGPSGSGKSTLANLILGLDSPSAGAVLFDGQDLAGLNRAAVRRQIGVVRQSGRMVAGSIFENILGMHTGTLDDAWAAADLAGIGDDIRAMPMGMHTVLAEGVSTFSGGQVQRMLMARALVGKPRILMLDEATSALDNLTQAAITSRIERLGVTRIVIAHRLSTIRNADAIHFMEGGKIAESGTFDQLIALKGRFADFVTRQTL